MMVGQYVFDGGRDNGPRVITAAAQVMMGPSVTKTPKRPAKQGWQSEAFELRDQIGELRFSGDRVAKSVSQLRPFAGRVDDTGDLPTQVDEGPAYELCARLFRNIGATQMAMFRAAQHVIYNGETWPVISEDADGDTLSWTAYSSKEISQNGRQWKVNDGLGDRTLDPATELVVRAWIPHPEQGALPDCGTRAILPVARELKGLTEHVSAQIDSRLAGAGILAIPSEVEVLRGQGNPDRVEGDDEDELDPFVSDLMEMMITPIGDRASASAVVPFVVKVPGEYVDKIRHIKLHEPLDPKAKELREEAIRRIAFGMDSPPEVLLGLGSGSNHWSAWAISEEDVKLAVAPIGVIILHAITVGWFQPMLKEMGVPDWDKYVIWYDASALQLRPDRSSDSRELFDKGELSADAMRRENGFADTDAPNEEQKKEILLTKLLIGAPSLAPVLLPLLGIEVDQSKLAKTAEIVEATGGDAPSPTGPAEQATPPADEGYRSLPEQPDRAADSGPTDRGAPA